MIEAVYVVFRKMEKEQYVNGLTSFNMVAEPVLCSGDPKSATTENNEIKFNNFVLAQR